MTKGVGFVRGQSETALLIDTKLIISKTWILTEGVWFVRGQSRETALLIDTKLS